MPSTMALVVQFSFDRVHAFGSFEELQETIRRLAMRGWIDDSVGTLLVQAPKRQKPATSLFPKYL
jgi:hypothetical protein